MYTQMGTQVGVYRCCVVTIRSTGYACICVCVCVCVCVCERYYINGGGWVGEREGLERERAREESLMSC